MADRCPVCGGTGLHRSVRRDRLPVFQNVTYGTRAAAISAPQAEFELATCTTCTFSFNVRFDAQLAVYDDSYDNHVASAFFLDYYETLARMLISRLGLVDGTVYDVGCGKGEFLRVLCSLAPGIRGVGIDPSCTPVREANFELIRSHFDASLFADDARLVILRHVLEHLDQPVEFLSALRQAMPAAPLYVEVPDLDWILENEAYWDFCYEHCNYFTMESLNLALSQALFEIVDQQRSFGDQYQWALVLPATKSATFTPEPGQALEAVRRYLLAETAGLSEMQRNADRAGGIALWGMATKGVLLSTLLSHSIHGGIDMNPAKQGRFAAGSGVAIHSPAWLQELSPSATILVMNPNYLNEIIAMVSAERKDVRVVAAL